MANNIQGGTQLILNSSSTGPGNWYRIHPKAASVTVEALGTAAGSTISYVVNIEGSNNGVTPAATALGTITLSSAASPANDGFTTAEGWAYMRANIQSISTGAVQVTANCRWRA